MYASNYYNHVIIIQKMQNTYSELSKGKKPTIFALSFLSLKTVVS